MSRRRPEPTLRELAEELGENFSAVPSKQAVLYELLTAYREGISASGPSGSPAAAAAAAGPAPDITREFKPAKACVLQTLIFLRGNVFGQNNPRGLHDLFWSDDRYSAYRQYSDDGVSDQLFQDVGMAAVGFTPGTAMEDLPEQLAAGNYAVTMAGSVEDHMVILVVDGRHNGRWMEYDQLTGRGFRDSARIDRRARVTGVFH